MGGEVGEVRGWKELGGSKESVKKESEWRWKKK